MRHVVPTQAPPLTPTRVISQLVYKRGSIGIVTFILPCVFPLGVAHRLLYVVWVIEKLFGFYRAVMLRNLMCKNMYVNSGYSEILIVSGGKKSC